MSTSPYATVVGPNGIIYAIEILRDDSRFKEILCAFDRDGNKLWDFDIGDGWTGNKFSWPAVSPDGNTVYVVEEYDYYPGPTAGEFPKETLYALATTDNGTVRWQNEGYFNASPAAGPNGTVYIEYLPPHGADRQLIAYNEEDGSTKWSYFSEVENEIPNPIACSSHVFITNEHVYWSDGPYLHKISSDTGDGSKITQTSGRIYSLKASTETLYAEENYAGFWENAELTAYGVNNGSKRWTFDGSFYNSQEVGPDGTVYTAGIYDNGTKWKQGLVAVDESTKQIMWETEGTVILGSLSHAVSSDKTVYFSGFNSFNGSEWRYGLFAYKNGQELWYMPPPGESIHFSSAPAVGPDGSVYVAAGSDSSHVDGYLLAFDGEDGQELWRIESDNSKFSSPAVGPDNTVYVRRGVYGDTLNNIQSIGLSAYKDGNEIWCVNSAPTFLSEPAIGPDGTIYVTGFHNDNSTLPNQGLFAFDNESNIKWCVDIEFGDRSEYAVRPAIGPDGTVYVIGRYENDNNTRLWAIGSEIGNVLWTVEGDFYSSPEVGPDGTVYIADTEGHIYAYWGGDNGVQNDWQVEAVSHDSTVVHRKLTFALDSSNRPHIAYFNESNELCYQKKTETGWTDVEVIDSVLDSASESALSIDSNDLPHIVYWGPAPYKHVYWDGAEWQIEDLGNGGGWISFAVDQKDDLHISYEGSVDDAYGVVYCYRSSEGWHSRRLSR